MSALCSLSPPESDLDPSFSDDEVASTVNDGDGSVMEEDLKLQVSAIPHRIPKRQVSKLLKGKEREWAQSLDRRERLQLLDLPTDVLKEIVSQVTNTNDLAALALTHSALHDLAIPHIYSRFDIVWPDASSSVEPRTGVDALTYGLSTLVMHEDAFRSYPTTKTCHHCGNIVRSNDQDSFAEPRKRRRGNNYAQYTRKFSLGNGPKDWVKEYSIDREGGKMLGTMAALAIARMRNLETFAWDMPTGILRDVWRALASLGDRGDCHESRLERVWVRWHNNSQMDSLTSIPPPPAPQFGTTANVAAVNPTPSGNVTTQTSSAAGVQQTLPQINDRVESPTFSILPPLKSLSVLDIDEVAYLDEMSVLIAKSHKKLRELRVGIAQKAGNRSWVATWEGDDPTNNGNGKKRLGGALGTLVSKIYGMNPCGDGSGTNVETQMDSSLSALVKSRLAAEPSNNADAANTPILTAETTIPTNAISGLPSMAVCVAAAEGHPPHPLADTDPSKPGDDAGEESGVTNSPSSSSASFKTSAETQEQATQPAPVAVNLPFRPAAPGVPKELPSTSGDKSARRHPSSDHRDLIKRAKLNIETLELERVPLCVTVLCKALDWSVLTSITLLHCAHHEMFWKAVRRRFCPVHTHKSSENTQTGPPGPVYRLNLRKIHTNTVTSALMAVIRETLAPNTLKSLFLQDARSYLSSVTIDSIYRSALRRHRSSLQRVFIDSSEKTSDGAATSHSRWRKWTLTHEILGFITSGRMPSLRELGFTIDYRDWHYFLQRLPVIPHLRSLYIPFIADHPHGSKVDARDLAHQIMDIVVLRPEIELCYMGIASKCFEILESKRCDRDRRSSSPTSSHPINANNNPYELDDDGEDDDDDEDEDGEDDADSADGDAGLTGIDPDETESESSDHDQAALTDDEDTAPGTEPKTKLKLREILFYDDKIQIFKARHGKL